MVKSLSINDKGYQYKGIERLLMIKGILMVKTN